MEVSMMQKTQKIQNTLLNFICQNFVVKKKEIKIDESLVEQGFIDSFGLIEIVSFIEEEFGFSIEEKEMNRDNLGSVIKMVNYILRKRNV